jgi:hypothetical protein
VDIQPASSRLHPAARYQHAWRGPTHYLARRTSAKLSDYPEAQRAVTATKGTFWLVCTVDAHCKQGMNLQVNVV